MDKDEENQGGGVKPKAREFGLRSGNLGFLAPLAVGLAFSVTYVLVTRIGPIGPLLIGAISVLLLLLVGAILVLFWPFSRHCRRPSNGVGQLELEPGSWFKTWVIPLPQFHFHHEPYRRESSHRNFFGRDEIAAKLLAILRHSPNRSGSYLTAGYRGVGKTSFAKKVLDDYQNGPAGVSFVTRHAGPWAGAFLQLRYLLSDVWASLLLWVQKRRLNGRQRKLWEPACSLPLPLVSSFVVGRLLPGKRGWLIVFALLIAWFLLLEAPKAPLSEDIPKEESLSQSISGSNEHSGQKLAYKPAPKLPHFLLLVVTLLAFGVLQLYRRFGVSGVNPAQWYRWLWRPVLVLNMNLGHQKLDTQRLLFDLATLLALRYRNSFGILSVPRPLKLAIFLLLSLGLTGYVHNKFEAEHRILKDALQSWVFSIYELTDDDIAKLSQWLPANKLGRMRGQVYLSKDSYFDALRATLSEHEFKIFGPRLLRIGDKSIGPEFHTEKFCSKITNEEHPYHSEHTFLRGTYCVIEGVLREAHNEI